MTHAPTGQPAIEIVNPNGSAAVTAAVRAAAERVLPGSSAFRVSSLERAPEVIETPADKALCEPLLIDHVAALAPHARALVIACHGDPALDQIRRTWPDLVTVGIGEVSLLTAAAVGGSFGVVTPADTLVASKLRQIARYGLADRCVGVRSTSTGVLHPLTDPDDIEPYLLAARALVRDGARSIVLGCAALSAMSRPIADRLGVPVIDPTRSALAALTLGATSAHLPAAGGSARS